jgi:hypothetical protein
VSLCSNITSDERVERISLIMTDNSRVTYCVSRIAAQKEEHPHNIDASTFRKIDKFPTELGLPGLKRCAKGRDPKGHTIISVLLKSLVFYLRSCVSRIRTGI